MTTTTAINLTIVVINTAAAYLVVRGWRVRDFRDRWRKSLKDDPSALTMFETYVPSFTRMLWSFRRLKDSNWIPAAVRAAKYRAEMEPDTREKLDKYITQKTELS